MKKEDKAPKTKDLQRALLLQPQHVADAAQDGVLEKATAFAEGYKAFLNTAKTEREAAAETERMLKKAGYKPYKEGKSYKAGDKIYTVNRGKAVLAATIGTAPLQEGVRLSVAHIDSPRLDLKPSPLYENEELSYFKTHYYGGIRKYQWVTIPLSMHGVIIKADGSRVEVNIGEEDGDPQFCITDLLPHLSAQQNKRPLNEGIKGEELNILVGSLPFADKEAKERVKLETMRLINEKYGITERDFLRAEIEFVPAAKAVDIGFDRSMVGGYGQDDRVCAYTALMAEMDTHKPHNTSVLVLTDKEETGSNGNTGLASDYLFHFLQALAVAHSADYNAMLRASLCLSADVNAAFDPTFPDVFEKRNSSFINRGLVLTKYTGARGKSSTSDASAEYMGYVTNLFDAHGVAWQIGELGKVDEGGGGTIAMFAANRNIDVVDVGVPVLSMHAPFEITAKLDIYHAYRAFVAFASDTGGPTY